MRTEEEIREKLKATEDLSNRITGEINILRWMLEESAMERAREIIKADLNYSVNRKCKLETG